MPEFAAMTADMDESVRLVLDEIEELGLDRSTYVIFLSDNGGRGTIPGAGRPPVPRNYPLRGSKGSMYEGGIRVPFLVSGPGIEPGSVNRTPVTGLDILPTIADFAGYPEDLPGTVDGGSLRVVLGGGTDIARNTEFLMFHQAVGRKAQTAIRLGKWKLVKTWADDQLELFDLSEDIGETKDLAHENSGQASRLHWTLTQFLAEVDAETRKTE